MAPNQSPASRPVSVNFGLMGLELQGQQGGGDRPFVLADSLSSLMRAHFLSLAAAVSAACGALLAFLIRNGWFAEDDFLNLSEARDLGLSLTFLVDPIQGTRFSPGHRFVDWLVLQFPSHEWLAVVVLSGICLAFACFVASLITMETTGSATAALATALLLGTWVGWVRIGSWWATSAHTLPMMAFALGAVYAALVWDSRGRRTSLLVLSGALTAAALAFSVRAALVPPVIAVLLVVGRPPTRSITARELKDRVRLCWPPVVLSALVAVVFLVIEFRQQTSSTAIRSASPGEWVSFLAKWMFEGLPALVTNGLNLTIPGDAAQIGIGLLLIAGFVLAITRGNRSTILWFALLLLVFAAAVQVGFARLGAVGSGIAYDSRYHEGDVLAIAVLVPAIWAAAGKPLPRTSRQRLWAGVLLLLFAGFWAINGFSSARELRSGAGFSPENPGVIPRATFETLRKSLPIAVGESHDATLVNTSIPVGFAPVSAEPEPGSVWLLVAGNFTDGLIRTFFPEYKLSQWGVSGTPILIEDSGRAVRIEPAETRTLPIAGPSCLRTTDGSRWLGKGSAGFSIPLKPRRGQMPGLLTLKFDPPESAGPIALVFDTGSKKQFPDLQTRIGPEARGLRVAIPPSATAVGVAAWGGTIACVESVQVATDGRAF